jgi:hypothetical protein
VRIRLAIAAGAVLIGVGLALSLFKSEAPFTGDNGREIQLPAGVAIPAAAAACQPEPQVPPGTGALRLTISSKGKPAGPLEVTVTHGGRTLASGRSRAGLVDGAVRIRIGAGAGNVKNARVCVANRGPRRVAVLGQEVPHGQGAHVTDPKQPQTRAMRIEWFEPTAETRLARAGDVAHRYGLMKADWVGTWTFWVMLAVLVAVSAAGVALAAREVRAG